MISRESRRWKPRSRNRSSAKRFPFSLLVVSGIDFFLKFYLDINTYCSDVHDLIRESCKMADDNDKKSKSKDRRQSLRDESPIAGNSLRTVDSPSESTALQMKRKHVYDSLEHCRAVRSQSISDKLTKSELSTSKSPALAGGARDVNESSASTIDYIESLRSRSGSRSGRYHDTSMDGKPTNFKITTWNINGLKSWLNKRSGLTFIAQDDADVYCFQETKCDNTNVPTEIRNVPGYHCYWNGCTDKHSGVVCFSKKEPLNVTYGIGSSIFDKEGRAITLEFKDHYIVNVFVPNSGRKNLRLDYRLKWDTSFYEFLKRLETKKVVIVCGDMNVSHQAVDLANPKANAKTAGHTIEERENFTRLLDDLSLVDVFRYLNPVRKECYTYWTFMRNARERNIGWRLDYFLISRRWLDKTCDCIIRKDVFGSDHCPLSLFLAL